MCMCAKKSVFSFCFASILTLVLCSGSVYTEHTVYSRYICRYAEKQQQHQREGNALCCSASLFNSVCFLGHFVGREKFTIQCMKFLFFHTHYIIMSFGCRCRCCCCYCCVIEPAFNALSAEKLRNTYDTTTDINRNTIYVNVIRRNPQRDQHETNAL